MKNITIIENEQTTKLTKSDRKYIKGWAIDLLMVHQRTQPVEFGPVANMFWIVSLDGEIKNTCKPIVC